MNIKAETNEDRRVKTLIAMLEDKRKGIRSLREAAIELGQIGNKEAIDYLMSNLNNRPKSASLGIDSILEKLRTKLRPQFLEYLDAHIMRPEAKTACTMILWFGKERRDRNYVRHYTSWLKNPEVSEDMKEIICIFVHRLLDVPEVVDFYIWAVSQPDIRPYYSAIYLSMDWWEDDLDERILPVLNNIMKTKDPYLANLRKYAADILRKINDQARTKSGISEFSAVS